MQRGKVASRGLAVLQKFSRGRKLVGLVPRLNAQSDAESSSSDEEDVAQRRRNSTSSDAPSIDSSLERLNLLGDDSDEEINTSQSEETFVSRIMKDVAVDGEVSYENLPSLTSIPSLESANSHQFEPDITSSAVPSPSKSPSPSESLPTMPSPPEPLPAETTPAEPLPAVLSALSIVPKIRYIGKAHETLIAVPSPAEHLPAMSSSLPSPDATAYSVPSPAVRKSQRNADNSNGNNNLPSPTIPSYSTPSPAVRKSQRKVNNSNANNNLPPLAAPSYSVPSPTVQSYSVSSPAMPSCSLPSPAVQDMAKVPRKTRSKRKANTTMTTNDSTRKKRKIVEPINYQWKKGKLKSKADIAEDEFLYPTDKCSPLDYFDKYFSNEVMQDIVMNTNLYAVQCTGKSINFTEEDLKDFLSIMLMMGIVVMPAYTDYWATKTRYPEVADIMPLKRFEQIRRYIHFVDNTCQDSDRYFKVRPFVEKIRQNCLKTEEEIRYSVDEMTIPYKGNKAGNRKQYNPMKPDKWGFKCIVRAGMSGIVYDFLLYGGDDTFRFIDFSEEEERLTLGAKMVIALSKTILTPACVVYFDNYFATLDLGRHLRDTYGIFSLGTIRQNRLKGCVLLLMNDKDMKKKGRGTFSQVVDNEHNLAVVKWFDNKVVTLVSSYTDAYPVQNIKRYSREAKARIDVDCPQLVKHYNQHMGGVDLSDMLIALYRTTFKSVRWYTGIFAQMLDICVNNAWLLYRRDCSRQGTTNIKLKIFRWTLAKELQQNGRIRRSQVVPANINNVPIIQAPAKPRPVDSVRYDAVGHWQDYTTQGRCKYCKDNKTDVYCTKCNLRLCIVRKRNCFYKFHNK